MCCGQRRVGRYCGFSCYHPEQPVSFLVPCFVARECKKAHSGVVGFAEWVSYGERGFSKYSSCLFLLAYCFAVDRSLDVIHQVKSFTRTYSMHVSSLLL